MRTAGMHAHERGLLLRRLCSQSKGLTKPILPQVMAKKLMKDSAEKKGVNWDEHVRALQANPELPKIKAELEKPGIKYPDYFLKPFHACVCLGGEGAARPCNMKV